MRVQRACIEDFKCQLSVSSRCYIFWLASYIVGCSPGKKKPFKMASGLSEREIHDMKTLFKRFDQDGSGSICCKELGKVLEALNIDATQKQVEDLFKTLDKDGSGSVEFKEFSDTFCTAFQPPSEDELLAAFRDLDGNNDGTLSVAEVKQAMKASGQPLSDEGIEEMIKLADKDGDGKVNYKEFIAILKS